MSKNYLLNRMIVKHLSTGLIFILRGSKRVDMCLILSRENLWAFVNRALTAVQESDSLWSSFKTSSLVGSVGLFGMIILWK